MAALILEDVLWTRQWGLRGRSPGQISWPAAGSMALQALACDVPPVFNGLCSVRNWLRLGSLSSSISLDTWSAVQPQVWARLKVITALPG